MVIKKMLDREDYPDCVFCGERTKWADFDNIAGLLVFHCYSCGESVEVDIGIKDERLLRYSGSRQGRGAGGH